MNNKSLNILFLNSVKVNTFGGVERWMLNLGKGLYERGHKIYYSAKKGSIFINTCRSIGFPVFKNKFGIDYSIINSYRLSKILRKYDIDIVINHHNKDIKIARMASLIVNKKIVNIKRAGSIGDVKNTLENKLIYKRFVDGIITPTYDIKYKLLKYGWLDKDLIHVIKNGVIIPNLEGLNIKNIKNSLKVADESRVIGSFGRLVEQKQFDKFLFVSKLIKQKIDNVKFIIVGEGHLKDEIINISKEIGIFNDLILLDFQADPISIYAICDIIVMTSRSEGYPNVLLEAMSVGKPVVAFGVGGIKELIKNGDNGYIIDPFDCEKMAEICIELLRNEEKVEEIGSRAKKYVENNNSIKTMIDKTEEYIIQLYNKKFIRNETFKNSFYR